MLTMNHLRSQLTISWFEGHIWRVTIRRLIASSNDLVVYTTDRQTDDERNLSN